MAGGASYEKPNQRRALEVEELKKELADIWKTIYPVGSIYMSVNSTNPSSLFGGTWVPWGSGRVPVGVNTSDGNFNFVEKTGGASTHAHTNPATGWTTLTVDQIPAHCHVSRIYNQNNTSSTSYLSNTGYLRSGVLNWTDTHIGTAGGNRGDPCGITDDSGGNQAHNHSMGGTGSTLSLQPYITCYMWKRTA